MTVRVAVGVDGWSGGWVAVALDVDRLTVTGGCTDRSLAAIVAAWPGSVIGVDMPIGLLAGSEPRVCDHEARAFVGGRRASVFVMPPAAVMEAATHAEAVARCRQLGVPGVSRQAWSLRAKIAEAAGIAADPRARLYEVFPEASFRAMAGTPLEHAKRTFTGMEHRRALLAQHGISLDPERLGTAASAPADDVFDAAAVAWSAARIARGEAAALPEPAPPGAPRIWY